MIEKLRNCLCLFWGRLITGMVDFIFFLYRAQAERQTSAGVTYKIHSGCRVITQTLSQHFLIKALLSTAN